MNIKNQKPGHILAAVMMIMATIAALASTALWTLKTEMHAVNHDYEELAARSAAQSGLELAKHELSKILPKLTEGEKRVFNYGPAYFQSQEGKTPICQVIAYKHEDRIFLESRGRLVKTSYPEEVLCQKTVKTLISTGDPTEGTIPTLWRISD